MKDVKTFDELNRSEKLELLTHFIDGGEVEIYYESHKGWAKMKRDSPLVGIPSWFSYYKYRKAQTKPSINWNHVSDDFNWLAIDSFGNGYLFAKKPQVFTKGWSQSYVKANSLKSFNSGNCDWIDSLVKRPGYEGH